MLVICHRLRSTSALVHHSKINESNKRTNCYEKIKEEEEKKFVKLLLQLCQQGWKFCTFCDVHFLSHVENASFMWIQDCCKEITPIGFNMIWGKVKSSYDNLKQKEGERSKAAEYDASKELFDNFQKRFDLRKCQDNRRSCFCRPRSSWWVPQCH